MKEHIPIIEVNRLNVHKLLPHIQLSMDAAYFVALDCEMSGLGDRRKLTSKSVDERYVALKEAASSRSLLSVGVSCFSLIPTSKPKKLKLRAVTYNILTLCNEDYTVEPEALEFLVKHNFDFNAQYARGIPYYPGEDNRSKSGKLGSDGLNSQCLRNLFNCLVLSRKPIVLHNSLVDLVFLYQNLYGPTPHDLQTFLADLFELFPAGIYDTKYVADYYARMKASYLEYIFRKCQRENWQNTLISHLSIRFPALPDDFKEWIEWSFCSNWSCNDFDRSMAGRICAAFSLHGCCRNASCKLIHDVNVVILAEEAKLEKKRAKMRKRSFKKLLIRNAVESVENGHSESNAPKEASAVDPPKARKRKKQSGEREADRTELSDLFDLLKAKRSELEKSIDEKRTVRKITDQNGTCQEPAQLGSASPSEHSTYKCAHRAGFDAFMTGYCIAFFAIKHFGSSETELDFGPQFNIPSIKNQVALSGKDFSLAVRKSAFVKTSLYHDDKYKTLTATA